MANGVQERKRRWRGFECLAVLSVIAKLIGMGYRIPLVRLLGEEGVGLYQMGFPIYALLVVLLSGGISVTVARFVCRALQNGEEEKAEQITNTSLVFYSILSLLATVFSSVSSPYIARFLGNEEAAIPLAVLTFSLPFVAVSACVRGYFQGKGNLLPFGIGQIVEQSGKLLFGLIFAKLFARFGVVASAIGAVSGVLLSEVVSAVVLWVWYTKNRTCSFSCDKKMMFPLLRAALPITLGALASPLSGAIDSVFVVNGLSSLWGVDMATAKYGVLTGPVGTLLHAPSVVSAALSASLLPVLLKADRKESEVGSIFVKFAKQVAYFGLVCSAGMAIFAPVITQILYPDQASGALIVELLRMGSSVVFLTCFSSLVTTVLQGMGKVKTAAVLAFGGCLLKAGILPFLLKVGGIYGAMTASVVCFTVVCALGTMRILHIENPPISFWGVVQVGVSVAVFVLFAVAGVRVLPSVFGAILGGLVALAASIGVFVLAERTWRKQIRRKADNQP